MSTSIALSGTITSVDDNTIVYSINCDNASVSAKSELQSGMYISAMIDYSHMLPNGDFYAINVITF